VRKRSNRHKRPRIRALRKNESARDGERGMAKTVSRRSPTAGRSQKVGRNKEVSSKDLRLNELERQPHRNQWGRVRHIKTIWRTNERERVWGLCRPKKKIP